MVNLVKYRLDHNLYMKKGLDLENKLIEEAKQDSEKFAVIYDKYVEQIFRYVMRRVGDQDLAEDLVSQTFFDALSHLKSYEYRGYPFSSWLYKIAHNNVLKWYRVNSRTQKVDLEDIAELRSEEDVEAEVDARSEREDINALLDKLDYEDREIIRLKYFEEVSNIEISQVMGITPNNVGVKLYRALKKLKQLM